MSHTTNLQQNNEALQSILDTIKNLPEAGGGTDTSDATASAGDILSGKTAYVNGEKITGNIAFQNAKTITPSTIDQVAVATGYYTTGNVTVTGDSNLVADNIKSGTTIFGVAGTYEGGGGSGNTDIEDALVTRTITEYSNDRVTSIGSYAFYSCRSLTSVSFPTVRFTSHDNSGIDLDLTVISALPSDLPVITFPSIIIISGL